MEDRERVVPLLGGKLPCAEQFMPKSNRIFHEEMGRWVESQVPIGEEGNQPVSQVLIVEQEVLAFSGMAQKAFFLPSEKHDAPKPFFLFLFFLNLVLNILFSPHLPSTL